MLTMAKDDEQAAQFSPVASGDANPMRTMVKDDEQAAEVSPTASGDVDADALTEHLLMKQAGEHQMICNSLVQRVFITYQFHHLPLSAIDAKTELLPVTLEVNTEAESLAELLTTKCMN